MSMPVFPEDGLDITKEQAFNMLLGSIAMEELGLSHIINAEGEKLQYILGTLPHSPTPHTTAQELLEVNESITTMLEHIAHTQFLLKGKLSKVLEAQEKWCPPPCPPPCPLPCPPPCPPPCPYPHFPCCGPLWQTQLFRESHNGLWCPGQRFVWKALSHWGDCWVTGKASSIAWCQNDKSHALVSFHFQLLPQEAGQVTVCLSSTGSNAEPILKTGGYATEDRTSVYLTGSTLLPPPPLGTTAPCIYFSLDSPRQVLVEKATLTVTTIVPPTGDCFRGTLSPTHF